MKLLDSGPRGLARTTVVHQPLTTTTGGHQPLARTTVVHQPLTTTTGGHQPLDRTTGGHQPLDKTAVVHQPSTTTTGGHQPLALDECLTELLQKGINNILNILFYLNCLVFQMFSFSVIYIHNSLAFSNFLNIVHI